MFLWSFNELGKYIILQENSFYGQPQYSHAKLRVRIHVESAIERLKDFKIFQGNMALTLAPLPDQVLMVCGALCNLLKPLARLLSQYF